MDKRKVVGDFEQNMKDVGKKLLSTNMTLNMRSQTPVTQSIIKKLLMMRIESCCVYKAANEIKYFRKSRFIQKRLFYKI